MASQGMSYGILTAEIYNYQKAYFFKVYSIQHYVIKFVSDLRQVSGFLRFPPLINKTAHHDITEIVLKVALNTITLIHIFSHSICLYFIQQTTLLQDRNIRTKNKNVFLSFGIKT